MPLKILYDQNHHFHVLTPAPRRSTLAPLRSSPAPYGSSPVSDIIPTETTVGGSLHTPLPSSSAALYGSSPVSDIIPTETTVCGGLHTPLPNSSAEDISPSVSSGIIIASVGASVVVVLLIVTAVIVISVLVCLRKRSKGQHINNTDSVTYQHNSITKCEKAYITFYDSIYIYMLYIDILLPSLLYILMQPTILLTLALPLLLDMTFLLLQMMHMVYCTKKLLLTHPLLVKEQCMKR